MSLALHAEWTKLRTVPSTPWLLVAVVAFTVVASAGAVGTVDTSHCPSPTACFEDTTKLSLSGVRLGQAAAAVLAVLAVTNEYGTRMIATTATAMPRRGTALLAKAAVVTAVVLVAGMLGVLGSLAVGRSVLPGNGFSAANGYPPLSLGDGPTLRAAAGTVLYLGLIALLGLGLGAIIRDTAGGITVAFSIVYVVPLAAELVTDPGWHEWIQRLSPSTAGLAIQATTNLDRLPIEPWTGLGVLAASAAAVMAVAVVVLRARDV